MKREEDQAKQYQTFEDLDAYKIAREFRKAMYGVARRLPESEKFGLVSQIRRAAVSLTNQYLQYEVVLAATSASLSPVLNDITFNYN